LFSVPLFARLRVLLYCIAALMIYVCYCLLGCLGVIVVESVLFLIVLLVDLLYLIVDFIYIFLFV